MQYARFTCLCACINVFCWVVFCPKVTRRRHTPNPLCFVGTNLNLAMEAKVLKPNCPQLNLFRFHLFLVHHSHECATERKSVPKSQLQKSKCSQPKTTDEAERNTTIGVLPPSFHTHRSISSAGWSLTKWWCLALLTFHSSCKHRNYVCGRVNKVLVDNHKHVVVVRQVCV